MNVRIKWFQPLPGTILKHINTFITISFLVNKESDDHCTWVVNAGLCGDFKELCPAACD